MGDNFKNLQYLTFSHLVTFDQAVSSDIETTLNQDDGGTWPCELEGGKMRPLRDKY